MDKDINPALSIPAFYSGRSVLITGASGYLGKALIEKLLRSCPDMREIYLLIRPKKNVSIDERLQQLLTSPLFDKLRSEQPRCFEKLIPIQGDISVEDLGLSSSDRDTLIEKTSVIFHAAASVRFNNTMKNAVFTNIRSTRDICALGEQMKNLVALVHISTTYSQIDQFVVDEIVYPSKVDWRKTIEIVENLNEDILETFETKYIDKAPNYYVFTKKLAEQVIADYSGSLPCAICRPSIITPTLNEPVIGWLENFNGPVASLVGSGKGVLRLLYSDPKCRDNYIPIDILVKSIIVSAWKLGTKNNSGDTQDTRLPIVYNCATDLAVNPSRMMLMQAGLDFLETVPLEDIVWCPGMMMVKSPILYYTLLLLLHVLPASLVDGLLLLSGARPRLLKLQRKIFIGNQATEHFLLNEWDFRNGNLLSLSGDVPADNQRDFGFATDLYYDRTTYFKNCIIGSKKYLLHESMDQLDTARLLYKRAVWINRIVKILAGILLMWIIY